MHRGVSKYPALAGFSGAEYIRAWERLKARELATQGRTTRATVRVRRPMKRHPDLKDLPRNVYNAIRMRRWRASRRSEPSLVELDWKLFREAL